MTSYAFDALSRLSTLADGFAGTSNSVTLTRNPVGQIAGRTGSNDAFAWSEAVNVDRPYASNGLNQYATAGAVSFAYDARGNLTASGGSSYGYSAENQLVTAPGATLGYDPLGRLYQVSTVTGTTRFQYVGDQIAAEYDGSNTRLRRHVPGIAPTSRW